MPQCFSATFCHLLRHVAACQVALRHVHVSGSSARRLAGTCLAQAAGGLGQRVDAIALGPGPGSRFGKSQGLGLLSGLLTKPVPARSIISSHDTIPGSPNCVLLLLF